MPGPVTSLRPAVPNVPFGAREYAAVLNHRSTVGSSIAVLTLKSLLVLQQFPILAVSSPADTVSWNPEVSVTTDVTFHPPTTWPSAPSLRYLRSGPNGRSYTTEVTKRCRWSKTDGPSSHSRQ